MKASASADEIKFVFRKLAKELHPDINSSSDAKTRFQLLSEAYEVLGDPEKRARYDSSNFESTEAKEETRSPDPIKCSKCGKVTAQPRYAVYRYVVSLVITTMRKPIQGIFCTDCGQREALKASTISAFAGWWGFPWGPIYTAADIIRNAFGGYQPPGAKEKLLWTNALAFLGLGQLKLSYALAREVRKTAEDEIAGNASKLMEFLQGEGIKDVPALQNSWRPTFSRVAPHAILLLLVPAVIFFAAQASSDQSSILSSSPGWETSAPPPTNTSANSRSEVSDPAVVVPQTPPPPTCATPPENGAILIDNTAWSERRNVLEIQNGSGGDAIIKIRDSITGNLLIAFFAKSDASAKYENIPDGRYRIQYAFGDALDIACTSFAKMTGAAEFPGENEFLTTDDGLYIKSTVLSFTLYKVPNGNVRPVAINAQQFDAN